MKLKAVFKKGMKILLIALNFHCARFVNSAKIGYLKSVFKIYVGITVIILKLDYKLLVEARYKKN